MTARDALLEHISHLSEEECARLFEMATDAVPAGDLDVTMQSGGVEFPASWFQPVEGTQLRPGSLDALALLLQALRAGPTMTPEEWSALRHSMDESRSGYRKLFS